MDLSQKKRPSKASFREAAKLASRSERAKAALAEAARLKLTLLRASNISGFRWVSVPSLDRDRRFLVNLQGRKMLGAAVNRLPFHTAEEAALAIAQDPTVQERLRAVASHARSSCADPEHWQRVAETEGLTLPPSAVASGFDGVKVEQSINGVNAVTNAKLSSPSRGKVHWMDPSYDNPRRSCDLGATVTAEESAVRVARARAHIERGRAEAADPATYCPVAADLKAAALVPAPSSVTRTTRVATRSAAPAPLSPPPAPAPRPGRSAAAAPRTGAAKRGRGRRSAAEREEEEAEETEEDAGGASFARRNPSGRTKRVCYTEPAVEDDTGGASD